VAPAGSPRWLPYAAATNMNIHSVYAFIFRYTRRRRMRLFSRLFGETLARGGRLVDIGGYPANWAYSRGGRRIVLVNIDFVNKRDPAFDYIIADARRLPFRDESFDIAFSNSVIEHVGDPGDQQEFASEARRVGRGYFVQTPSRWFPIEPHLLTPLVHYLPPLWQRRLLRRCTVWGIMTKPAPAEVDRFLAETQLLTCSQMTRLFCSGVIIKERVLGVTKSFIAVRQPEKLNSGA